MIHAMYDNWGCEFIELEVVKPLDLPDPPEYDNDTLILPVSFLKKIANPIRLREISVIDADYIRDLQHSIYQHGLREPLLVAMGINSCALIDGHHRLLGAEYAGVDRLACKLQITNDNLAVGVRLSELYKEALWEISKAQPNQTEP